MNQIKNTSALVDIVCLRYNSLCLEWHLDENANRKPLRFLCGLARQQARFLIRVNRLVVALAKSQDHRASCGVFSFGGYCSAKTQQRTMSRWPTRKGMRLMTSQRENLQAVSQEQSKMGDGRLANVKMALWKLKPDLMGAVVLTKMAEARVSPFLACPIVKTKCKNN
jgi:hypothetical protein